jgi:hypothetical protein
MQTDRSDRFAALALGTTAIFDVTGAVIYRVLRAGLPVAPPPDPADGPFQQAARELRDAHREVITRARGQDRTSLRA